MNQVLAWGIAIFIPLVLVIAFVWGLVALMQIYGVWSARKEGEADLARAQRDQQIQKAEAQGRLDAAELNKQAELIDAAAVAQSIEIIGKKLHENEGYLRWQWIEMMRDRDAGDTIYVPTEAGLPILEAGKRG